VANDLTGDFDVVAEFAVPAVNRVLAGMHRAQRFLHSVSLRVDDNPPPGSQVPRPTVVGSVDGFGEPIVNHTLIGPPVPLPGQLSATNPIYALLDPVVNTGLLVDTNGRVVPSRLQGRVQMQLGPPTFEVSDASGKNITARLEIMTRYFPDPHTTPLAEFVRGELQISTAVDQVASQSANVVDINIKAQNVYVNFTPAFSSQPLSTEDLAGINLAIRNALKTSLLPSNAALPPSISYVQFRTLSGGSNAIAVLLNMQGGAPGDPGSLHDVFLSGMDDFALAVSADYVESAFHVDLSQTYSWWEYNITLKSVTIALAPSGHSGKIVVTVAGHAEGKHSYSPPGFDFTVHQDFALRPASMAPGGPLNTAELVPGDIYGGVTGELLSLFGGNLLESATQDQVREMFNVDANLGGFLESLLTPPRRRLVPLLPQPRGFQLAYTSADIQASGIVLHGSLAVLSPPPGPEVLGPGITPRGAVAPVPGWPYPHVEFEQIPATPGGGLASGGVMPAGLDYSALKSWIPGGRIVSFEWSSQGQTQPFLIDDEKFVLMQPPPDAYAAMVVGYTPLCLTIKGKRLSASGPVVEQDVSATQCGYTSVPIVNGIKVTPTGAVPFVALTQLSPGGQLQVTGHTAAHVDRTGRNTPNLLVHFADEKTAGSLQFLTRALRESGRQDATTVVLAVLTPDLMAKAGYVQGITYSEDEGSGWEGIFDVKIAQRPLTLIVAPSGSVVWQHQGELDGRTLAAALKKSLAASGPLQLGMLSSNLKIGQAPPNFLFDHAPGHELTLRKLAGRAVTLVFWKSSSRPSIEAVRDQQQTHAKQSQGPVVLAINDGEAPDLARRVASENALSATIVTDPQREIALAYGVILWPTIVLMDAFGLVTGVRYGRAPGRQGKDSFGHNVVA
jgi:peroxiredoxin